jgi:hypothetical protein
MCADDGELVDHDLIKKARARLHGGVLIDVASNRSLGARELQDWRADDIAPHQQSLATKRDTHGGVARRVTVGGHEARNNGRSRRFCAD